MKICTTTLFFPSLGYEKRVDYYQPEKIVKGVIYFHDGQNIFKDEYAGYGRAWRVKEFIEAHPGYRDYAIVAVWHGEERYYEYCPWQFPNVVKEKLYQLTNTRLGGGGFLYVKDLAEVVVPYFSNKFNYKGTNCLLAGSSMGGLISLVAGCEYPQTFPKIGALSNALWCSEVSFFQYLESVKQFPRKMLVTYGDKEAHGAITDDLYTLPNRKLVRRLGQESIDLREIVVKGGRHHETAWEKLLSELFLMMEC